MAFFSQAQKKEKAPAIKAVLKKYGVTGSIAVRNHSTLVVTIRKGKVDFFADAIRPDDPWCAKRYESAEAFYKGVLQVNAYWLREHWQGKSLDLLTELHEVMNIDNYNNSDVMSDYFDVGWHTHINIGQWDKPYIFLED